MKRILLFTLFTINFIYAFADEYDSNNYRPDNSKIVISETPLVYSSLSQRL